MFIDANAELFRPPSGGPCLLARLMLPPPRHDLVYTQFNPREKGMEEEMANTFSQIYIHTVFAVSARQCLIKPGFKEELQKYITGIIRKQGNKLIEINSMPDHAHLLNL